MAHQAAADRVGLVPVHEVAVERRPQGMKIEAGPVALIGLAVVGEGLREILRELALGLPARHVREEAALFLPAAHLDELEEAKLDQLRVDRDPALGFLGLDVIGISALDVDEVDPAVAAEIIGRQLRRLFLTQPHEPPEKRQPEERLAGLVDLALEHPRAEQGVDPVVPDGAGAFFF